jgi:hypothetical protein
MLDYSSSNEDQFRHIQECDELMEAYRDFSSLPITQPALDVARTMAFSCAHLYRISRNALAKVSKSTLLKPFDRVMLDLNNRIIFVLRHLIELDSLIATYKTDGNPSPTVDLLFSFNTPHIKDLQSKLLAMGISIRQMLTAVDDNLNVLVTNMDKMAVRTMISAWYTANAEMSITLQALTGSLKTQIQQRSPPQQPPPQQIQNVEVESNEQSTAEVSVAAPGVDQEVLDYIYKAATAMAEALQQLKALPDEAINTISTVKSSGGETGSGTDGEGGGVAAVESGAGFRELLATTQNAIDDLLALRDAESSKEAARLLQLSALHEKALTLVEVFCVVWKFFFSVICLIVVLFAAGSQSELRSASDCDWISFREGREKFTEDVNEDNERACFAIV